MSSMTFGELVKSQMKNPSDDVVKAAEYVIQFGKHKGMNLSMLMEEQNSYCQWLLKQDESQNPKFNETIKYLKILILDNQVGLEDSVIDLGAENNYQKPESMKVDGGKAVLHIDNLIIDKGVVKVEGAELADGEMMILNVGSPKIKPVVGLLMGMVTDLMQRVDDDGLTFDFSSEDINVWLALVGQVELGVNQFVIIETTHKSNASHAQKIKMVVSDLKKLKGVF